MPTPVNKASFQLDGDSGDCAFDVTPTKKNTGSRGGFLQRLVDGKEDEFAKGEEQERTLSEEEDQVRFKVASSKAASQTLTNFSTMIFLPFFLFQQLLKSRLSSGRNRMASSSCVSDLLTLSSGSLQAARYTRLTSFIFSQPTRMPNVFSFAIFQEQHSLYPQSTVIFCCLSFSPRSIIDSSYFLFPFQVLTTTVSLSLVPWTRTSLVLSLDNPSAALARASCPRRDGTARSREMARRTPKVGYATFASSFVGCTRLT
jgi:hypothetical protein